MTLQTVIASLKCVASEKTRATYVRHGNPADRTLGVSVADMKTIAKTIRGEQGLALSLYGTGMLEAMYLAGLVADGAKMTRPQLQGWAEGAVDRNMIYDHVVPWVAVENAAGRELAVEWIAAEQEAVAAAGWRTYNGLLATQPDDALDLTEVEEVLDSIPGRIVTAPNRVRAAMNSFVICVGSYVVPLHAKSGEIARRLGAVAVDVGDTACQIPLAMASLAKVEAAGKVGQKKKTIRC